MKKRPSIRTSMAALASGKLARCRPTVTNPVRVDVQVRLGAPDSQRLLQILDYVFTLSGFHLNQIRPMRNSF